MISVHGEKEVVEGHVSSTDPNAMVHFVRLGEGVIKVWVDIVKVPNAPLWRPTSEFEFIEDAIGSTIAWPSANVTAESSLSKNDLYFFLLIVSMNDGNTPYYDCFGRILLQV